VDEEAKTVIPHEDTAEKAATTTPSRPPPPVAPKPLGRRDACRQLTELMTELRLTEVSDDGDDEYDVEQE